MSSKRQKKTAKPTPQKSIDLGKILGAGKEAAQCFTVYLPNKDRNGKKIKDYSAWVRKAKMLLARINNGATVMPPTDGVWLNEESGKTIEEKTILVYSFIQPERFESGVSEIRLFLHEFGRETNQGEVSCEFCGYFYRIVEFDEV